MSIVRFLRIGVAVMTAMILGGSKSHCQETRKGNESFHGYFFLGIVVLWMNFRVDVMPKVKLSLTYIHNTLQGLFPTLGLPPENTRWFYLWRHILSSLFAILNLHWKAKLLVTPIIFQILFWDYFWKVSTEIQLQTINMNHLVNKPYVDGITLRMQNYLKNPASPLTS